VTGQLAPGTVVSMALLLSRLYGPLAQLSNARVNVMSALVSFERVFEVLDLRPMVAEKPDARELPEGPVSVRLRTCTSATRRPLTCHWRRWRKSPPWDARGGEEVLHGIDLDVPAGSVVALVGSSGAGKSSLAALVPGSTT